MDVDSSIAAENEIGSEAPATSDEQSAEAQPTAASPAEPAPGAVGQHEGIWLISAERERQEAVEGFNATHDDARNLGELAQAAECYAGAADDTVNVLDVKWPFEASWWKPRDRGRNLIRAGALFMAEGERALRMIDADPENADVKAAADKIVEDCGARADAIAKELDALISTAPAADTASETPAPPAEEPKVGSDGAPDLTDFAPDPDHWQAIVKARDEERNAESDVLSLAEELKAAKKVHEKASEYLGRLIDEAKAPTLFTKPRPAAASVAPADGMTLDQATTITDAFPPAIDDAWKSVFIADLTPPLKPGKLKALAEHTPPILTMGEMAAWQESKGQWWIKDIAGFGPGGAEQYAAACDEYWRTHPQGAKAAEPVAVLQWVPWSDESEGGHATNTAGIMCAYLDPPAPADFSVTVGGARFEVSDSDDGLLPDDLEISHPNGFDTVDTAKAWCEARNAELVAQAAKSESKDVTDNLTSDAQADDSTFDADEFDADAQSVISLPGLLVIDVRQRRGGRYAECHFAQVGKHTLHTKMDGKHASRAEAITAAADAVDGWIKGLGDLIGSPAKRAKEIRRALDGIDKTLGDEPGSASSENRAAVAEALA